MISRPQLRPVFRKAWLLSVVVERCDRGTVDISPLGFFAGQSLPAAGSLLALHVHTIGLPGLPTLVIDRSAISCRESLAGFDYAVAKHV